MMKRIIALLLALILTVGLLPTVALAAEGNPPTTDSGSVTKEASKDNLDLVKTVTKEGDNYKVTLESWATGTVTSSSTPVPMDIILLLDQSGSMKKNFTSSSTETYNNLNKKNKKIYADYRNNCYIKSGNQYLKVTVTYQWEFGFSNDVYTYTWNGGSHTSTGGNSKPKIPLFYKSTTNSSTTRIAALKTAVSSFINKVNTEATTKNVDHRVAVVGFASTRSDYYENTELLSTPDVVNYGSANNIDYRNALVSAKTNKNKLDTAINRLAASGDTYPEYGFDMANQIFAQYPIQAGENRQRVVIMFTDGYPAPAGTDDFNVGMANNAINNAKRCKDNNAKVYTIGIFDGADPSASIENYYQNGWLNEAVAANRYMHFSSSNYPSAMALNNGGTKGEGNFYFAASNADALNDIFDTISEEISTDTTELDDSATIIDNIPGNFAIPEDARNITLKVAKFQKDGTFATATTAPTTVTAEHKDGTVTVTGFNFSDEWCGLDEGDQAHGSKLIIEFTIKHNNYGGTQPTNAGASIKDEEGKEVIKVDDPTIPVKITEPSITGVTRSKVYDGTGFDVLSTIAEDINALADGKKNAYVDIVVTVTSGSNTYTYTIKKGDKSGSWDKTGLTTDKDVKIENGAVSSYTYDLNITFKDATDNGATEAIKDATATYTITKRPVILTSGSDEKKYDGTPLTKHEVTAATDEGVGFVGGDGATYTFTGSQTEAGESDNTFDYILNDGTVATNYEITKQVGKLKVTKDDTTKITVTITGKTETKEYNGQTQTVTGFDYTVTGADKNDVTVTLKEGATASASGKDVKTDNDGKYMMGLIASNFTVSSDKYSSVTIKEVEDGWIKITPAQVTLTSETASKDYDGAPLTKPDVTVGGSGQDVFKSEVTGITATGTVTDPGPAVDNTITYTPDTNFKESNYNISKSEGKLSINDIAAPTNLPTVNVYCTNTEVEHADSTGNALKNNTYTSVVSKNAENKYICTITLTDKNSYISDYDDSTGATHTSDTTKTDFTKIILHYDTDAKAWPTPIVNFALNVKCDTPTVNVTYTWDGLDENDFDTVYPVPAEPDDAKPNKGSDYTVNTRYNNSSIAIGKNGVRYKFSGWSSATEGVVIGENGKINGIQTNVTLTGHWTKLGSGTFDLTDKIFKSFTLADGSRKIPAGTEYTFAVHVTPYGGTQGMLHYGDVKLKNVTGETRPSFNFNNVAEIECKTPGTYTYLVEEAFDRDAHPDGIVDKIHYDTKQYLLTISVENDLTVKYGFADYPQTDGEAVPKDTITFRNSYFEDHNADIVTLDLSKYVTKTFESRHGKSATETFEAKVQIWLDAVPIITNITNAAAEKDSIAIYAAANGEKVYDKTGTVTLSTGETKSFSFSENPVLTKGHKYKVVITEIKGSNPDVEYDTTEYNTWVTTYGGEISWWYGEKEFSFTNTYTGIDDYYPIIIPTIINKDTGMLNKTDHFAYVIGYPDGTVHPNGQITRAEVATIFFRLLRDEVRDGAFTTSNSYSDVAYGKWYNNPISTMSALGIITGYPDGTFKPNKPITRAEFAAIAARFDETQSGKSATFSDVIGHWAAKEIGIAYYNDWIKGYPDGTFKPDQNITRAEAMTLINRVLERKPESPADLLTNMNKWTDNMDTSKWYYLDVQEATNSHGYTRKTFNYELWRQMLPDPDWSRYER